MNLKNIMLCEKIQTGNITYCMTPFYEKHKIDISIDTKIRLMAAKGWGRGSGDVFMKMDYLLG